MVRIAWLYPGSSQRQIEKRPQTRAILLLDVSFQREQSVLWQQLLFFPLFFLWLKPRDKFQPYLCFYHKPCLLRVSAQTLVSSPKAQTAPWWELPDSRRCLFTCSCFQPGVAGRGPRPAVGNTNLAVQYWGDEAPRAAVPDWPHGTSHGSKHLDPTSVLGWEAGTDVYCWGQRGRVLCSAAGGMLAEQHLIQSHPAVSGHCLWQQPAAVPKNSFPQAAPSSHCWSCRGCTQLWGRKSSKQLVKVKTQQGHSPKEKDPTGEFWALMGQNPKGGRIFAPLHASESITKKNPCVEV